MSKKTGPDRGERAVDRINQLTHTKGRWAGQRFNLRPWQESIIRSLFGTVDEEGHRRYRTCYVEIPRKNGKSELAAAIALYCLVGDDEAGGEVYSAAADRDQASLVFNVAAQMVRNSRFLSGQCKVIDSQKRIIHHPSGSVYRAISAEAYSKHGFNASAVIYDELHAAPTRELWDVLTTSMSARAQPLALAITTAGWDRNSICWELHSYAGQVRDGLVKDDTFLPVIYAADPAEDWLDEDVWKRVNPALGDFRSLDEMRVSARRAQRIPAQQNVFRRLYLNQWTEQSERWLDMADWDACSEPVGDLDGASCYVGVDLGSTSDLTAAVLVFPDGDGGYSVVCHFWVPADTVKERTERGRVPYEQWVNEGLIHTTPGNVTDYDFIEKALLELAERYRVREMVFDRWHASQLMTHLIDEFGEEDGREPRIAKFGQGFKDMSPPSKELERLVLSRRIRHGGNPVLRWMASNVVTRQDPAGNLKIDKDPKRSHGKVDGMVALAMGLGRAMSRPEEGTIYDERGLLVV